MAKRKNQPSGQLPAFRILAELMDTLMGRDDAWAGKAVGGLPDPFVSLPDDGDDSGDEVDDFDDFGDFDELDDDLDDFDDLDDIESSPGGGPMGSGNAAAYPGLLTPAALLAGEGVPQGEAEEQEAFIAPALKDLRVSELREIATALGWKLSGQRREDVLASLLAHYGDEASLTQARGRIQPEARRFMGLLQALSFPRSSEMLRALQALSAQPAAPGAATDWRRWHDYVRQGLVLEHAGQVVLPQGLYAGIGAAADWLPPARDLKRLKIVPAPDPLRSLTLLAETVSADPKAFSLDAPWGRRAVRAAPDWSPGTPLITWPTEAGQRKARILPVGNSFASATLKRVQAALGLRRPSAAELMLWVYGRLVTLGSHDQPDETDPPSPALRFALRLDGPNLLALLWELWRTLPYGMYDEWSWVQLETPGAAFELESVRHWSLSTNGLQAEMPRNRELIGWRILQRLSHADAGQDGWLDLAGFLRLAALVEPRSGMGGSESWLMTDKKGEPLKDWQQGGALIWRYLIEVPLHSLGLVDLAYDAKGELQALRLSAAGRSLAEGGAATGAGQPDARWADAETLNLPLTMDHLPLLNSLHLCCRLQETKGGRATFHLDQSASRATFRAGGDAEAIQRALAARQLTLPPAVAATLDAWSAGWGQWVLRPDWSLLTFADEATAEEVLATGALADDLVCRLSPTHWLVDPDQADAVLAALKRAGHRPMVHDAPPSPSPATAAATYTPRRRDR